MKTADKPIRAAPAASCAAPGCDAAIPESHLMCAAHWRALPPAVRLEVDASYKSLRRVCASAEFLAAVARYRLARQAAIRHFAATDAPSVAGAAAATIGALFLTAAACLTPVLAGAQELAPQTHEIPQPPPPPGGPPSAGGAPFADVRARLRTDPGGREFREDRLDDRDVLYNLQVYFTKQPGLVPCPGGAEPTRLAAVVLDGVHLYEQALRFGRNATLAGAVFQRAIAYYRGTGVDGNCAGLEIRSVVHLVRLSDDAWFAPEWRRSLVKRR